MDRYTVTVKITFVQDAENLEDALRRALARLPDHAIVLEANAFPAQVESEKGK